jgi:hypothetical protein
LLRPGFLFEVVVLGAGFVRLQGGCFSSWSLLKPLFNDIEVVYSLGLESPRGSSSQWGPLSLCDQITFQRPVPPCSWALDGVK